MARGSKPGERRGGRKAGTPNKATKDIRAIAQQYTGKAIARLVYLMDNAESEAAQAAAARELLDRGHGKSKQPLEHDVGEGLEDWLDQLAKRGGAGTAEG